MKTLFLSLGLLASMASIAQTTSLPTTLGTANASTYGSTNVFLGALSGSATTSNYSVFVGNAAGQNQIGNYNICIGYFAGKGTSGSNVGHNNYIGYEAGYINTGGGNVMLGDYTGASSSLSSNSTFVGFGSGQYISSSSSSVYFGTNAGQGDSASTTSNTAVENTYIGADVGKKNTTGKQNVFLGRSAGINNSTGNNNVYLGYMAGGYATGSTATTGSNNVYIGSNAGIKATTGSNNIFIGSNAGGIETTNNNRLYIANSGTINPLIYGEFKTTTPTSSEAVLKFNAQKVGIGYNDNYGFGTFPNIGSTYTPDLSNYRLFVKGGILAYEVRIRDNSAGSPWPDYVFAKEYKLLPLKETEQYIAQNGHLPNMPSAAQVAEEGIEMGHIARLQQEKIEELTLHLIEQEKQIDLLKAQNAELLLLKEKVEALLNKQ